MARHKRLPLSLDQKTYIIAKVVVKQGMHVEHVAREVPSVQLMRTAVSM